MTWGRLSISSAIMLAAIIGVRTDRPLHNWCASQKW